jgi:tetratricopeptide (TPR) repeat protein
MAATARLAALLASIVVTAVGQSPDISRYASDLRGADTLLSQGDFNGVIETLGSWPERLPDRPEAHHFLGLAHYRLRNFSEAARHLAAALEREEPGSAPWKQTVEILGVAYFFEGRWQEAEPLLEQASGWKPDDSELLYTLAMTYVQSGRANQARVPFSKIFQVDPASPQAFALTAELLLQENRLDDAEALLLKARELQRGLQGVDYELGVIELRRGDYAKAAALFRKGLENSPQHAAAWHSLGETLLGLGRHAESVEALKRAIWLDPHSLRSNILLAKIYIDQNLMELAEDTVRRVIQVDPQSYEAHFLQSRIYYKTGRPARAREHLGIAEELRRAEQRSPQ